MKHLLIILLWTSILMGQGYQERKKQFTESLTKMSVQLSAERGNLVATYYDSDNNVLDTLRISDYPRSLEESKTAKSKCLSRIVNLLSESNNEKSLDYEGKKLLAYVKLNRLFQNGGAEQLISSIKKSESLPEKPLSPQPPESSEKDQNENTTKPKRPFLRKGGFNFFVGLPKAELGISGYFLKEKNVGFYGDIRIGIPLRGVSDNPNYYDSISENTFNDPQIDKHWDRIGGNIGVTFAFSNNFIFYVAGGLEYRELLVELDDPLDILGDSRGHYWVKANKTKTVPNLVAGTVIYQKDTDSFGIHIGFHTASLGIEGGVAFAFPFKY